MVPFVIAPIVIPGIEPMVGVTSIGVVVPFVGTALGGMEEGWESVGGVSR